MFVSLDRAHRGGGMSARAICYLIDSYLSDLTEGERYLLPFAETFGGDVGEGRGRKARRYSGPTRPRQHRHNAHLRPHRGQDD